MDERTQLQKQMGKYLRNARHRVHLTQEQLAEMIGVSTSYYANIESGRKGMHPETLKKLSEILHVSVDCIIYGDCLDDRQIYNITAMLRGRSEAFLDLVIRLIAFLLQEDKLRQEDAGREEVLL